MPPAGALRITDVTHSTMRLNWDAAHGAVRKYIITYKPEDGDLKEVRLGLDDPVWCEIATSAWLQNDLKAMIRTFE